jgi:hypothetical protein
MHTITVFAEIEEMKKTQHNKRAYAIALMAFVALLVVLAVMPLASAAGAITLTPTAQVPSASVSVSGTGFGATKAVGIGFGAEVAGSDTNMAYTGTSDGLTWSGRVSKWPIKPGSFVLTSDTTSGAGLVSVYTDNGDGTTTGTFEGAVGTINYTSGQWTRVTTVDVTGIATIYTATYIWYQYNVTPAAGVTTLASGTFTASITVPAVANGIYNVTAIDAQGNRAVASLTVDSAIPEGLTVGVMVSLSTVAVIVSTRYFRKRPKIENSSQVQL